MSQEKSPPAEAKESLALDAETVRQRIGDRRFRLLQRWVVEVVGCFDEMIAEYVGPDVVVLDAGCSRGDPDLPSLERTYRTFGSDVDILGLRANKLEDQCVLNSLDTLPFEGGAFDVVVSKFVVEHLEDPLPVFKEWARVLKPGGVVIIMTPNLNSVFSLLSRIIPEGFKVWMKVRLFGGHEGDTFPTHYRANTAGELNRFMGDSGLEPVQLRIIPGMWAFFSFSVSIALLVRAMERLQARIPGLRSLGTQIVAVWRKPL